jgi:hypothetical protein
VKKLDNRTVFNRHDNQRFFLLKQLSKITSDSNCIVYAKVNFLQTIFTKLLSSSPVTKTHLKDTLERAIAYLNAQYAVGTLEIKVVRPAK